jgi:hypothetical protein
VWNARTLIQLCEYAHAVVSRGEQAPADIIWAFDAVLSVGSFSDYEEVALIQLYVELWSSCSQWVPLVHRACAEVPVEQMEDHFARVLVGVLERSSSSTGRPPMLTIEVEHFLKKLRLRTPAAQFDGIEKRLGLQGLR